MFTVNLDANEMMLLRWSLNCARNDEHEFSCGSSERLTAMNQLRDLLTSIAEPVAVVPE